MEVHELADGLWSWTARHPDWQRGFAWNPEVRCFYVETDEATLVLDPLVPADEAERFWRAVDRDVERRALPVAVLLTQASHARSAGELAARYGAEVWGHERARDSVRGAPFHSVAPGDVLPGEARALALDQEPGRSGTPLYLPSHGALAVGDVFITVRAELRVWWAPGASGERWYRERLLPSLRRWLELEVEHVLVAHGDEVAPRELARALERTPYDSG